MPAAFVLMRVRQDKSRLETVCLHNSTVNTFPYAADRTEGRGKPGTEREAEDADRV